MKLPAHDLAGWEAAELAKLDVKQLRDECKKRGIRLESPDGAQAPTCVKAFLEWKKTQAKPESAAGENAGLKLTAKAKLAAEAKPATAKVVPKAITEPHTKPAPKVDVPDQGKQSAPAPAGRGGLDISGKDVRRVMHTQDTTGCDCRKNEFSKVGEYCDFYMRAADDGDKNSVLRFRCKNKGDRLAHTNFGGGQSAKYGYVWSCASCNAKHGKPMYVKEVNFKAFECKPSCKANYRGTQTMPRVGLVATPRLK